MAIERNQTGSQPQLPKLADQYAGFEAWTVGAPGIESWQVDNRVTTLSPDVPVTGFESPERANFIVDLVQRVGFPLNRVTAITHRINDEKTKHRLGSVIPRTGELNFYKKTEGLPPIAQLGVAAHEIGGHENSPLNAENIDVFGSQEAMDAAAANAYLVAMQTGETGKFLNGYHAELFQKLQRKEISLHTFIEETNAIMIEQRIANPTHLAEVLVAQNPETAQVVADQLDSTLMILLAKDSRQELNQHIFNLHEFYNPQPNTK
jgi:hypothetical protein